MDNLEKHVEEKAVLYTSLMLGIATLVATIINVAIQLNPILIKYIPIKIAPNVNIIVRFSFGM